MNSCQSRKKNQVVTSTKILQVPSLQLFSLQVVFIVSIVSDQLGDEEKPHVKMWSLKLSP